jgi:hypothetical protein
MALFNEFGPDEISGCFAIKNLAAPRLASACSTYLKPKVHHIWNEVASAGTNQSAGPLGFIAIINPLTGCKTIYHDT